jgi:hypothetical protein
MAKAHVCVLLAYLSIAVAAKKCANVKVKAFADSSGEYLCLMRKQVHERIFHVNFYHPETMIEIRLERGEWYWC